ncbi:MAG TPA: pitrilysin family protein [Gemmatimonadales bacterium]|nr:pitrilysin family protein [Gemmatimonadales bacterium]
MATSSRLRLHAALGLGALLALGAAAAPVRAQQLHVPYSIDTLRNGLTLIVHEDHSVPIVSVNTWRHVGSGDEAPGRTGLAHLYEHLMFMGSLHAPYPMFDRLLEAAGGDNNASTWTDATNYYENGPSSALPLMLWLEADRTGYFLQTMDSAKVDLQRDVVKNERRQSYENQPYGMASLKLTEMLYPVGHPYHHPTIGSMADLTAASLEDVKNFFRKYYAPNNTTLVVAGDVSTPEVKRLVEGYFGGIPAGKPVTRPAVPAFQLARDTSLTLEDRVELPRLYNEWHSVKAYSPDDAALDLLAYILTGAKNSRLTRSLVYEQQVAANVFARQDSRHLDGAFTIVATARPGHSLDEIQHAVDSVITALVASGPTPRELEQARNSVAASFLNSLERVAEVADQLNRYYYLTGQPDYFQKDLARYDAVTASDVQRVARKYLTAHRVYLRIVPQGRKEVTP